MSEKINGWCVPYVLGKLTGRTSNDIARVIADARGDGSARVGRVGTGLWISLLPVLGIKVLAEVHNPGMTLARWAKVRIKWGDKNPWIIRVSGHALLYRNGVVYDNAHQHGIPVESAPSAKRRICSARQIDCWNDANPIRSET